MSIFLDRDTQIIILGELIHTSPEVLNVMLNEICHILLQVIKNLVDSVFVN